MAHHVLETEKLQAILSFLQKAYTGQDEVHEMIKSVVNAQVVTLAPPADASAPASLDPQPEAPAQTN